MIHPSEGALPPGTLIDTPTGPTPIESLAPGDLVLTPSGPTPILSLTHAPITPQYAVLLHQDALAPSIPSTPLTLPPEALLLLPGDTHLTPAAALLNATSITRTTPPTTWLSLNLGPQTTLTAHNTHIASTRTTPHPTHPIHPIHPASPTLNTIRTHIAQNTTSPPTPPQPSPLTPPPLPPDPIPLTIKAHGTTLPHTQPTPLTITCTIPPHTGPIQLNSPPRHTKTDPTSRTLGLCITTLTLDSKPIPLNNPILGPGFHPTETNGPQTWRWTNATAWITLPYTPNPQTLTLTLTNWHLNLTPA